MRRSAARLFCIVFFLALPAFAAGTEAELRSAVKTYREALVAKDVAALEKIWTKDYHLIDAHGKLRTRAERLADLRSGATALDRITHSEPPTITIHGNIGIVEGEVTISGRYSGKDVAANFRSTHIWVWEDGRWQLMQNQLTKIVD